MNEEQMVKENKMDDDKTVYGFGELDVLFIKRYLKQNGETLEDALKRIRAEQNTIQDSKE